VADVTALPSWVGKVRGAILLESRRPVQPVVKALVFANRDTVLSRRGDGNLVYPQDDHENVRRALSRTVVWWTIGHVLLLVLGHHTLQTRLLLQPITSISLPRLCQLSCPSMSMCRRPSYTARRSVQDLPGTDRLVHRPIALVLQPLDLADNLDRISAAGGQPGEVVARYNVF
jgi:hypothetical protein